MTSKTLELLHMDLMAVMRTESLGGKKYILVPICGTCQKGKKTRSTHKRVDEILISKPLELLHMDLTRPMRIGSLGGKKYILVMVDGYSRYALYSKEKRVRHSYIPRTLV